MSTLYDLLGVSKKADAGDIKKAYRKLAKKYHPDLNPHDKTVADKFQKVTSAYEILSDETKRGQYDRGEIDDTGNPTMPQGSFYGGGADFQDLGGGFTADDIFSQLFGGGRGRRGRHQSRPTKGQDLTYTLKVSFLDAALGSKKKIVVGDGSGVDLTIPAGFEHGHKLRLKGKGYPGTTGGEPGDAFVEVHIAEHPYWTRKGRDIYMTLPITWYEAVLGGAVTVPTIHGSVKLKIPQGCQSGQKMRLKGKGIMTHENAGDQYVILQIMMPQDVNSDLSKIAEEYRDKHPYSPRIF